MAELPPLEMGSATAVALHRIWEAEAELSVRSGGLENSLAAAVTIAVHLCRRMPFAVTVWTPHVDAIREHLALWTEPGEIAEGPMLGSSAVMAVTAPPLPSHHHATVLIHERIRPATAALAAVDIGPGPKTIRLLKGAALPDEPVDIAIAGGIAP